MYKIRSAVKAGIELLILHCSLSIIMVNALTIIIDAVIFYQLIPVLLNYPPDYVEYIKSFSIAYWFQYFILSFFCLVLISVVTYISVKEVDQWHKLLNSDMPCREKRLSSIRCKCHSLPYRLYVFQILAPAFTLTAYSIFYMIVYGYTLYSFFHITLVVMTFFSLTALINFLFAKMIFTGVLRKTGIYGRLEGKRVSLRSKMLLQILPISIVSILLTSMLGYSRLIEDRSNFLFRIYKSQLESSFSGDYVKSVGDIGRRLAAIDVGATKVQYFIRKPDGEFITSDGKALNRFFTHYAEKFADSHNGRIYDEVGSYSGAVIRLGSGADAWSAGVRYRLSSRSTAFYLEGNFIILTIIIVFIVYLSSRTITADISAVTASLQEIAAGWNIKSMQRIPITANDEIGDLILAINKIRDLEQGYDTMKNEFIANISHEFRTPLNIILNAVQLSARYIKRSTTGEDAVRLSNHMCTMRQNCYRLLKLINNMIDSSKIEASFFKLYMQNCNIVAYIRQLVMSVSDYIKDKEINLVFNSNVERKIIPADLDAIERIMLNLLANAVKFSKRGSEITIVVTDRGDRVEISVRDTGIGIPAEKLQHIFKRFSQVDNTLTKSHEGSGIGLSIVKSLVELHKGSVWVESKQGEGTVFVISLPAEVPVPGPDEEGSAEHYESRLHSGVEKIDIEFSDL